MIRKLFLLPLVFNFGQTAFAQGTTHCAGLSSFHGKGRAFCGDYFGEHGCSSTILCVPTSDGKFQIGGFFIKGNLTEEQNYRNCLDSAILWNAEHSPHTVNQTVLPYPENSAVQCIEGSPNQHGVKPTLLVSEGRQLGNEMWSVNDCVDAVKNRTNGHICAKTSSDFFYQTISIMDGTPLRQGLVRTMDRCVEGIRGSTFGRVCSRAEFVNSSNWYLFDSDGKYISGYFSLESCLKQRDLP